LKYTLERILRVSLFIAFGINWFIKIFCERFEQICLKRIETSKLFSHEEQKNTGIGYLITIKYDDLFEKLTVLEQLI
jgi:hypothetical protein